MLEYLSSILASYPYWPPEESGADIFLALCSPSKHLRTSVCSSVCIYVRLCDMLYVKVSINIGDAGSLGTDRCWHRIPDTSAVTTYPSPAVRISSKTHGG